jgi:SAM-dependent methyltransferase
MVENARDRWNRRYRTRRGDRAPARWLTDNRRWLPQPAGGRRALDVACGMGANAVWLARLGFEVDAVDISDVAIDAIGALAAERELSIRPARIDLEHDPLPDRGYDLIVQIDYLQRSLFSALAAALAPGGVIAAETVTADHAARLGNHFDPRFLLGHGELRTAFEGLEVISYRERVVERRGRPRAVASLVARRPSDQTPVTPVDGAPEESSVDAR